MTHQYTKLADELDAVNDVCGSRSIREAARILRAAAAVDVTGLMQVVKDATAAHYLLGLASGECQCTSKHHSDKDAADAALESDLRLALAAREGFVLVPVEPTPEMVDAARSLTSWPDGIYRAMLAAAPKGTP
jgi:hypothetical protein